MTNDEEAVEKMRAALKPFADEAEMFEDVPDDFKLMARNEDGEVEEIPLTVGHLRKASLALDKQAGGDGWRTDFENAPKDGTPVDLWIPLDDDGYRMPDCFYGKPNHECISQYCDMCPPDLNVKAWREPMGDNKVKPSHWRSIPARPHRQAVKR